MDSSYPMAYVAAPGEVAFQDVKPPPVGPDDIKIRVKIVTLCGSDLHIFKGKHPSAKLPVPVGHEISGEIIEIGSRVSHLRIGERVAIEPVIVCGDCHYCLRGQYSFCTNISFQYRQGQGGITPFFVVPAKWAHILSDSLSYTEGAMMEPLSVAIHAVRMSRPGLEHTSAIFGAGAIGLLVLQVLRNSGAGDVYMVDVNNYRLETAIELGASQGLNNREVNVLQEISNYTADLGVDRSFEAVGMEVTLIQALKVLKNGGTATLVGLFEQPTVNLPTNLIVQKEIALIGSQGYCWDFQTAIRFAAQKRVDLMRLVTHQIPFDRVSEAFEILLDPNSKAIKIAILID